MNFRDDSEFHVNDDESVSSRLFDEVKVLCWVLTSPGGIKSKAIHVNRTWGKRCNKLLLMSTKEDESMPNVVALNVGEGRSNLWGKTKKALQYIYDHHLDEADWFLKADDDT